MALDSIANRLTPSVPMEITYGAQAVATGRKITTLFGHKAASGDTAQDYSYHNMVNVGDPVAAKAEVDALAGAGSQIGKMAAAFINANLLANRSNFPAFRVVFIPNAVTTFGPADEALNAVKMIRNDMLVSCYPASDSANKTKLDALVSALNGVDRDLNGQFGSFALYGCIDIFSSASILNFNKRESIIAYLQDTNNAAVNDIDVNTTSGSNILSGITSTAGIYPGATITGTGIPAGALVGVVNKNSLTMVDSTGAAANATATGTAVSIDFQNLVSQASEIVAAAHAGGMMSSAFPYMPLQNVQVGGLLAPQKNSDRIIFDPSGLSEAALVAGLSPLATLADGTVRFVRTRTTLVTLPGNIPVTNYFDWQQIVTLYDFREDIYQISQQPPFNNNPGGTKASQQIAAKFKDQVIKVAKDYEDEQAFENVAQSAKLFQVIPSVSAPGRFDFRIPVQVIPGLYVIAGNIVAVSDLLNFTF